MRGDKDRLKTGGEVGKRFWMVAGSGVEGWCAGQKTFLDGGRVRGRGGVRSENVFGWVQTLGPGASNVFG